MEFSQEIWFVMSEVCYIEVCYIKGLLYLNMMFCDFHGFYGAHIKVLECITIFGKFILKCTIRSLALQLDFQEPIMIV